MPSSPPNLSLSEIGQRSFDLAVEKGWYEKNPDGSLKPRSVPEMLVLIHSEISEALEEYRNGNMATYRNGEKPEGFGIEIADAVIRIGDMMHYLGYDLNELIETKHAYNKTRPYRHGGKKC